MLRENPEETSHEHLKSPKLDFSLINFTKMEDSNYEFLKEFSNAKEINDLGILDRYYQLLTSATNLEAKALIAIAGINFLNNLVENKFKWLTPAEYKKSLGSDYPKLDLPLTKEIKNSAFEAIDNFKLFTQHLHWQVKNPFLKVDEKALSYFTTYTNFLMSSIGQAIISDNFKQKAILVQSIQKYNENFPVSEEEAVKAFKEGYKECYRTFNSAVLSFLLSINNDLRPGENLQLSEETSLIPWKLVVKNLASMCLRYPDRESHVSIGTPFNTLVSIARYAHNTPIAQLSLAVILETLKSPENYHFREILQNSDSVSYFSKDVLHSLQLRKSRPSCGGLIYEKTRQRKFLREIIPFLKVNQGEIEYFENEVLTNLKLQSDFRQELTARIAALYILADNLGSDANETKIGAWDSLAKIEKETFCPDTRTAALSHLWEIVNASKNGDLAGDFPDIKRRFFALPQIFASSLNSEDEKVRKSSLDAIDEALNVKKDLALVSLLEQSAFFHPDPLTALRACAILSEIYIYSQDVELERILKRLSLNSQFPEVRKRSELSLKFNSTEIIYEKFNKKIKELSEKLAFVSPNIAIYLRLENNSLNAPFGKSFRDKNGNSYDINLDIHLTNINDKDSFAKAWQNFHKECQSLSEDCGWLPVLHSEPLIGVLPEQYFRLKQAKLANLHPGILKLPVKINLLPTLFRVVLKDSSRAAKFLENSLKIIEPDCNQPMNGIFSNNQNVFHVSSDYSFKLWHSYAPFFHTYISHLDHDEIKLEQIDLFMKYFEEYQEKTALFNSNSKNEVIGRNQLLVLSGIIETVGKHKGPLFFRHPDSLPDRLQGRTPHQIKVDSLLVSIWRNIDKIVDLLIEFESHEVAIAEIQRAMESIKALSDRKKISKTREATVTWLPKNEPFYSFINEVVIPSFLCKDVYINAPEVFLKKDLIRKLSSTIGIISNPLNNRASNNETLGIRIHFPGKKLRNEVNFKEFLKDKNIDTVIFAGPADRAKEIYDSFENENLKLIGAGSGHNPLIITASSDLNLAVRAALDSVLRNSGQDCTSPCAILVEDDKNGRLDEFLKLLNNSLLDIPVGDYKDWYQKRTVVGALNSAGNLKSDAWNAIREYVTNKSRYHNELISKTTDIIDENNYLVKPAIFKIPLEKRASLEKMYSPFFNIQSYTTLDFLEEKFFKDPKYMKHAMYVSIYGDSDSIREVEDRLGKLHIKESNTKWTYSDSGHQLHPPETILRNKHLNSPGVDCGLKPFGGYGLSATYQINNGTFSYRPYHIVDEFLD